MSHTPIASIRKDRQTTDVSSSSCKPTVLLTSCWKYSAPETHTTGSIIMENSENVPFNIAELCKALALDGPAIRVETFPKGMGCGLKFKLWS